MSPSGSGGGKDLSIPKAGSLDLAESDSCRSPLDPATGPGKADVLV